MGDDQEWAEFVRVRLPASPEQLFEVRAEVRRWLAPLNLTVEAAQDVVAAVDEAVSNAVDHAYLPGDRGNVELTFWTEARELNIEVTDNGRWRSPAAQHVGEGLGIHLMRRLVESVMIHYDKRGTRVLLRYPLSGVAPDSGAPAASAKLVDAESDEA